MDTSLLERSDGKSEPPVKLCKVENPQLTSLKGTYDFPEMYIMTMQPKQFSVPCIEPGFKAWGLKGLKGSFKG